MAGHHSWEARTFPPFVTMWTGGVSLRLEGHCILPVAKRRRGLSGGREGKGGGGYVVVSPASIAYF